MYQVRYFLSVARVGSFTRAAEECGVAQPSLSRAIKQLEVELGGELFRRERPQALLTELGTRMLPILTRCHDSANAARALADAAGSVGVPSVRLALSSTIALESFLPWLGELRRAFRGLVLRLTRDNGRGALETLKTGTVELAVTAVAAHELPATVESWPLFEEGFHLCCRSDKAAPSASLSLADLTGENIVLPFDTEHGDALAAILRTYGVEPERCCLAASSDDMLRLVANAGNSGAIVSKRTVLPEALQAYPIDNLDLRRTVSVHRIAGRPLAPPSAALLRLLRGADWAASDAT